MLAVPLLATDWPQWRGIERNGISTETGLLKSWPADGPPLVWKTQGLGEGYRRFRSRAGCCSRRGSAANRSSCWRSIPRPVRKFGRRRQANPSAKQRGHGPRGTPTLDGDRLYALAADGTLVCLAQKTGKAFWTIDLMQRFGARIPHWGISESPLVDGNQLIVTPGGNGAGVVALDKKSGETIWKSQSDRAGYSSAVAFDLGGIHQMAILTGQGAIGLNLKNGELLWRYDKVSNRTANIATPIYHDGYLFVSTAYGTGCALLKLTPEGGSVKATEVYFNGDMMNHYTTSVLVGDYLYGFSNAILTAMKFATGEVVWKDRSVGKGNVTYAEGKLYLLGETGIVGLAEATPSGYKEISRFKIPKGDFPTWTPPVLADGKMYLREQDNLYCFDIKAR
jgi:hypothetical protein